MMDSAKTESARKFLVSKGYLERDGYFLIGLQGREIDDLYKSFLSYTRKKQLAECDLGEFLQSIVTLTHGCCDVLRLISVRIPGPTSRGGSPVDGFYLIQCGGMINLREGESRWLIPGALKAELVYGGKKPDAFLEDDLLFGFFMAEGNLAGRKLSEIADALNRSDFVPATSCNAADVAEFIDEYTGEEGYSLEYDEDGSDAVITRK